MGVRLIYAKVIDRESFYVREKGTVHPSLDSEVLLREEPGAAGAFLVLRAWGEDTGAYTEQWRIESPGGVVVYESTSREIHASTEAHVEKLEDEVADLKFDYAADYDCVFTIDENEVGRITFPVRLAEETPTP